MKKKTFTVKVEINGIEANTQLEARKKFWEIVDDMDFPIKAKVKEEI